MKKCKVIEFIPTLNDGGAETLVKDYAILLDKEKFEVIILTLFNKTDTAVYKMIRNSGISILSIYHDWSLLSKVRNKINGARIIEHRLRRILKDEKPDVLHAHLGLLKYLYRVNDALYGVKLFYTCHSLPQLLLGERMIEEDRAAKFLINKNGLTFIALQDEMREQLNLMYNVNSTVVVRNGIDFERFNISEKERELQRNLLNIKLDTFVVGHVGRLSKTKNHRFLIDIFCDILKFRSNSKLLLIGDGELKEEITKIIHEREIDENVIILSHRDDVPKLLKAMDVFVFPSLHEGFGIALVEAQAAGLKCVVSDTIPVEAYLSDLVIPLSLKKSSEEWACSILNMSERSNYPYRMDMYNMRTEIKKLEELYLL